MRIGRYVITSPGDENAVSTDEETQAFLLAKDMSNHYGWPSIILDRERNEWFQLTLRGKAKRPFLRKLVYKEEVE